jgi:hypothetical protein
MKPLLNKWQLWCRPFEPIFTRFMDGGWHVFDAGIIKIHTMPKEGEALGREHYRGVIIRFSYWLPIDRTY